jgi:putative flippase GtrA
MRKVHHRIRAAILKVVDFFYPPFRKFMTLQMYRYAACGGGNTLLNIFIYFITYNYILEKQVLDLGWIAFTPHIAAFFIAFCITFPIGFYLSMYVVFHGSYLRRRIQLIRYFLVAVICIFLNYVLLKLFVETFEWYPTPSLMITAGIVILFSYLSQRHFSFRRSGTEKPGRFKVKDLPQKQ